MIPPGLVTKRRVLASAYIAAMVVMLSGTFAPAARDTPWGPALAGVGILALAVAGTAAIFFGLRSGRRRIPVALVTAGVAAVVTAAWLVLHFRWFLAWLEYLAPEWFTTAALILHFV